MITLTYHHHQQQQQASVVRTYGIPVVVKSLTVAQVSFMGHTIGLCKLWRQFPVGQLRAFYTHVVSLNIPGHIVGIVYKQREGEHGVQLLIVNPTHHSATHGASPAITDGSHSVTCHLTQVNVPALTSARQAGTRIDLPTPEGQKAELTLLLVIYRDGLPVCRVTDPSTNHLIATGPVVEPMNSRS